MQPRSKTVGISARGFLCIVVANKNIRARVAITGTTQRPFYMIGHLAGKEELTMRKYTLASSDARSSVDLRAYAEIIESAIHEVMPHAIVQVEKDYYCVDPTPKQGDAIRIGRQICRSALCQYCVQIPKLFSSIEIKPVIEGEKRDGTKQSDGGHF